jgi:hypothetical protein
MFGTLVIVFVVLIDLLFWTVKYLDGLVSTVQWSYHSLVIAEQFGIDWNLCTVVYK